MFVRFPVFVVHLVYLTFTTSRKILQLKIEFRIFSILYLPICDFICQQYFDEIAYSLSTKDAMIFTYVSPSNNRRIYVTSIDILFVINIIGFTGQIIVFHNPRLLSLSNEFHNYTVSTLIFYCNCLVS